MTTYAYLDRLTLTAIELPLATGVTPVVNDTACLNTATGKVTIASALTTLIPIGRFRESFTGDDTKKIEIELFQEIELYAYKNDGAGLVGAANLLTNVYLVNSTTVSTVATSRSVAGRPWKIDGSGSAATVWIQPPR